MLGVWVISRPCNANFGHYKLRPIHQYLLQVLELKPSRRALKALQVDIMPSISIDEAARRSRAARSGSPTLSRWSTRVCRGRSCSNGGFKMSIQTNPSHGVRASDVRTNRTASGST